MTDLNKLKLCIRLYQKKETKIILDYLHNKTFKNKISQLDIIFRLRAHNQSNTAHTLRKLKMLGLIQSMRHGKYTFYQKTDLTLVKVIIQLTQDIQLKLKTETESEY